MLKNINPNLEKDNNWIANKYSRTYTMQIKYAHTNLIAADWQKHAQFYIDVFGCKLKPPERDLSDKWVEELTGLNSAHI